MRKDLSLIQLLDPPFDKSDLNPGYIKGYVPGVRENGGQYTHAAIWLVMAFAESGNSGRAWELFQMINPVNHGNTPEAITRYKVEPYVLAADVYAMGEHGGRGGWTWYTGSAGWMYQLIVESFLGLVKEGNVLRITPCIPKEWPTYTLHYHYGTSVYHMVVTRTPHVREMSLIVDRITQTDKFISLSDDGLEHTVDIGIPVEEG